MRDRHDHRRARARALPAPSLHQLPLGRRLGTATRLRDERAKAALAHIVDHIVPGRAGEARPPNDDDLRDTIVLTVPIEEASAKVRTGPPTPPSDEDRVVRRWAGEVPLALVPGVPIPTEDSRELPTPASVSPWRRPG